MNKAETRVRVKFVGDLLNYKTPQPDKIDVEVKSLQQQGLIKIVALKYLETSKDTLSLNFFGGNLIH